MRRLSLGRSLVLLICAFHGAGQAQENEVTAFASPLLDLILVLDNSGSMKANDPAFLTREVVASFLEGLSEDSRIGFVVFAEKAELALALTDLADDQTRSKVLESLGQIDYSGQYTNTPAAIERAIYELKQNGRTDAEKLILFLTDGIIDTGDRVRDLERQRWLENELVQEGNDAGIRIFGIAFTDQADFELIQTLGQRTGGGYFRAFEPEDISTVFNQVQRAILNPPDSARSPSVVQVIEKGLPTWLILIAVVGLISLVFVAIVLLRRPHKQREGGERLVVPEARLLDRENVTGKGAFEVGKKFTRIGREEPQKGKLSKPAEQFLMIPEGTVSALHATIEYRDTERSFFLIDHASTNGTFLNGERIASESPCRLHPGDVIQFADYAFEFVLPGFPKRSETILSPMAGPRPMVPGDHREAVQPSAQEQGARLKGGEVEPQAARPQEHFASDSGEEEKETVLKQLYCEKHPSVKNTEVCPVCKRARCRFCMREKDGRKICATCLERQAGQAPA
jgi:Mg-chelatase subunit ChlD